MTTRVVVLGANGMLGHMVAQVLGQSPALEVVGLTRAHYSLEEDDGTLELRLRGAAWVINCIGVTKPRITEADPASVGQAVLINSWLPYKLAALAQAAGARMLQIGTDCVYSGERGRYFETDPHDAQDVYGRTKSLGEPMDGSVTTLRCSIIGPELGRSTFLWEWLKGQPEGAHVKGFAHHIWNGVTTLAFARLCRGLILAGAPLPRLKHFVPADALDKASLLVFIADALGRKDLRFELTADGPGVNRSLATRHPAFNDQLWQLAGYKQPPLIQTLVQEMAEWRP